MEVSAKDNSEKELDEAIEKLYGQLLDNTINNGEELIQN